MIIPFQGISPVIHPSCFLADSADIIGAVELSEDVSVWFQAVLRGDNDSIRVGARSNVQDGVVIHVDPGFPCQIGEDSVIGHKAVLHGCTIGARVLIGIGATVLNGAQIPDDCLIGAGALVTENKQLESGYLYMGVPAKKVRPLKESERAAILKNTKGYVARAQAYKNGAS